MISKLKKHFLKDNFDESKRQIEGRIDALSHQIVRQLQLISLNCRHGELVTNVTGLDESLLALGSSAVSADELQDCNLFNKLFHNFFFVFRVCNIY